MILMLSKSQAKFLFSINSKFYDIVSIGHTAQKVAVLTQKHNTKIKLRKLFIESSNTHFESNLEIFGKGQVKVNRNRNQNTDVKLRNQVERIDGAKNTLVLKNGQEIRFNHLIYSGEDHEWKDIESYKGLKESLSSQNTDTFADIKESDVQNLYGKINTDIYFSIDSQRHFAADNFFMIHLADSLKNLAQNGKFKFVKKGKITILNKGQKVVPFNFQIDSLVKSLLTQNGIEIVNNTTVEEIKHRKREILVNKNGRVETIQYGGFYQYLPFKVPELLAKSGIDPLDVDHNTLLSNQYPTVHVIGNIVPTAYSFYASNYMAHVTAQNIINMELKSDKRALYEGDTVLPFWTGTNSLRYLAMNYQKTKSFNNIGENKYLGRILGMDREAFGNKQVSMYLNGSSYGLPYYFIPQKSRKPTLIQAVN